MHPSRKIRLRVFAVLTVIVLSGLALAQSEAGAIAGSVKDASGAVIGGATVKVKSLATGIERTATTGSIGQYQIQSLTPGEYEIVVSSNKFETYKTTAEVTVGGISTVDVQLTVGQSSAVVEVVGGAPTEVNTQTQEVSQLIDTQQLASLPSLTRNPYDFVALSGNVSNGDSTTPNVEGSQNQTGRGTGYSLNGQRESGTEILLDGVENTDLFNATVGTQIPVDSVQEYSVITNNFGAEYGRASGGVVNLTTKSGTNNFHGSAWEYNRLSAYTANTYNDVADNIPKGVYTRNQFGAQGGGPLIKNKLFVYTTAEWLRVRSQPVETEEVLDPSFISMLPANVQAYFNAYGTGLVGSTVGQVTAGQLAAAGAPIPAINGITAVSPSQPVFDITNFKTNFNAGGDIPQNTLRLVGRMDYNLSDKTQMFFRFGRDNEDQFPGTVAPYSPYAQYDVGTGVANDSLLYSISHTFNSNLLNNTKVSYSRINLASTYDKTLTFIPDLILTNFAADPTNGKTIQFPGLENTANGLGGLPVGGPIDTIQLEHDLSWTKGTHNLRFGGQFTYIQTNYTYGAYNQAVEFMGNSVAQGLDSLVNAGGVQNGGVYQSPVLEFINRVNPQGALPCVGNADVIFNPSSLIVTPGCTITPPLSSPNSSRSYRDKDWAIFAQDSWRFTPRLTLNYGLRYEHYGVQHDNHSNLDSNFYFGSGSGIEDQVRNGQVQIADQSSAGGFWKPSWGTASPRVGFAYDIFGDGKSSLRGGFGISYERNFGNVTFNASFNPPASAAIEAGCVPNFATGLITSCQYAVSNDDLGPLGTASAPAQGLPPVELRFIDPNIRTAQTQFWNLDVQREVARNTIVDVGYSGAHGVHLYDIQAVNQAGAGQFYLGDPSPFESGPGTGFPSLPAGECVPFGTTSTTQLVGQCFTRPNQQYASINMRGSSGSSAYDALNVKFQTQDIRHTGLSLIANYTWAHSLDDLSSTFSDSLQGASGSIGSLGYTDPFNPKLDWGSSDYDIKHRIVISPIWETPWFKNEKGLGEALGGWMVSGIFTARTGTPFSVFDYDNNLNFLTVARLTPATSFTSNHASGPSDILGPNLFGVLTVPLPASTAPLDPALALSDFGPFPAGMMARNTLRGPGAWNIDAAIQKNFKVTERFGLQFRAEGFNVLNHHNLYVYTGNLEYGFSGNVLADGFNQVTALKGGLNSAALGGNNDERRFGQFSLRLNF
jgi:carboxypeptidase family protein/TonB-dependent receptor-like protein